MKKIFERIFPGVLMLFFFASCASTKTKETSAVAQIKARGTVLIGTTGDYRRASSSLHDFLEHESAHSVVAAIGSERGWTERERDLLESSGFSLCSMGSRILRTETAATVASSIILDSMGYLG